MDEKIKQIRCIGCVSEDRLATLINVKNGDYVFCNKAKRDEEGNIISFYTVMYSAIVENNEIKWIKGREI